jgi:hypothetical protein
MLIALLIHLLIILLIAGIIYAIVDAIWPGDVRFKRIAMAILALILVLYLLDTFGLGFGNSRLFR